MIGSPPRLSDPAAPAAKQCRQQQAFWVPAAMRQALSTPAKAANRGSTASSGPHRRRDNAPKPIPAPDALPDAPAFPTALPEPGRIIHFPDTIGLWLRSSLDDAARSELRGLCGGKLRVENRPARFDPEMIQRIVPRQPSPEAIKGLARRNDTHFNAAEIARDLIYATEEERDAAYRFHLAFALRKGRQNQIAKVCLGQDGMTTLYSGPIGAESISVAYPARSKITKDKYALHQEERAKSRDALMRLGIRSLNDLLALDYCKFWDKHLQFWRVKPDKIEALGLAINNLDRKAQGLKLRRKAQHIPIGRNGRTYNVDLRTGYQAIRSAGLFDDDQITLSKKDRKAGRSKEQMPGYWTIYACTSIQNLYDRLSPHIRMDRYLERISIRQVLGHLDYRADFPPI